MNFREDGRTKKNFNLDGESSKKLYIMLHSGTFNGADLIETLSDIEFNRLASIRKLVAERIHQKIDIFLPTFTPNQL